MALALHPAVDGHARLVPGAAVAAAVVVLDGDELVVVEPAEAPSSPTNLGSAPLATVDLAAGARTVLASGPDAVAAHATAVDEWRALTARWLVGLGRESQAIGVQYAKDRKQFDVAVGSFQAVQHRFADLATDLDGADLLSNKAVWALDVGDPVGTSFPAMAFWFAGDTAQRTASWALHVHGGYGFMEEYDIQLHFRRAKATRLLLGDPKRELQLLAGRLWDDPESGPVPGSRLRPTSAYGAAADEPATAATASDADGGFDFRLGAEVLDFRREVREFLGRHVTPEVIERAHHTGTIHDNGLHAVMAEAGWISAGWPAEFGGQGRSPLEMNALTEEMYLSGAPVDGLGVASLVAHTLLIDGTDWQKRTIIPEILSGKALCCLGYSEPDAGSDVAACTTKAVQDGDEWTINGQKMFTTMAHEAQYVFLLTRTNTEVAKHKGLTMFVVPMDQAGVSITPVHTMGGERTNITYYDDVKVDDKYRVGEVDGGWKVMMTALVFERNSAWYGELVRLLDHGLGWARSAPSPTGGLMVDDPLVRERLARIAVGNEISNLLGWRAAWMASEGTLPGVEGTMAKLFTTEHYQFAGNELIDALGTDGLTRHGDPTATAADGWIEAIYRHCQVTTIYGGTSEVLRGIIAERGLQLPRNR
ncbi:acyl-CoA dehydrogenase family protein [Aquihabitans sp. G128]|uniref:acyl-CoA dehydrogenase family protein n=1 Tax=Aquihabitans sp. G128 TaxID=2849779 RepID=UPI001C24B8AF|nr:acyl-CoA dehydrogenase family protein [Aquihabitans sp. G128]QXC62961.1 acyl-CoA dehydrogenase family protein [Aquihabitans sp. G128]